MNIFNLLQHYGRRGGEEGAWRCGREGWVVRSNTAQWEGGMGGEDKALH